MVDEVHPAPPLAHGTALPWDMPVDDAVAHIATARATYGDTFAVHTGDDRYLFTFSPRGVESFYALPEDKASKGLADYLMLSRKLPDEVFAGRRTLPSGLFRRDDVTSYLANLELALDITVTEMGRTGTVDVFDLTRRLAHRMGLASWAGHQAAQGAVFDTLTAAFDTLDGAAAFVHPDTMSAVTASDKRAERQALETIVDSLAPLLADHPPEGQLLGRIIAAWNGEPGEIRTRGIILDITLIHIASMSNLAAALGWLIIDLMEHPHYLTEIDSGTGDTARRCALESIRLAQRSLMSRSVLTPVTLDTGAVAYDVPPGWTIATLLPLLNTSAGPDLDHWDPYRWTGHRIADAGQRFSPTLVTAFGHGRHSCPAQPFSLSAMTAAASHLVGTYHLAARWTTHPRPVPAQIGGVARAADPCLIDYTVRQRT